MTAPHPGSHDVQHAPTHYASGTRPYFPTEEWEQFERSDLGAGAVIVALMTSIFTAGLILYSIVLAAVLT
jgi:hypothetical protein